MYSRRLNLKERSSTVTVMLPKNQEWLAVGMLCNTGTPKSSRKFLNETIFPIVLLKIQRI